MILKYCSPTFLNSVKYVLSNSVIEPNSALEAYSQTKMYSTYKQSQAMSKMTSAPVLTLYYSTFSISFILRRKEAVTNTLLL